MFIVPLEPMKRFEPFESIRPPQPETTVRPNTFQNVLYDAIAAIEQSQAVSRIDAYNLAFGNVDDLSPIMINTLKAESMLQTTVQVTSRVIAAYKEIMGLQV